MYTYKATIIKVIDGDTLTVDIDLGFNVIMHNQGVRLARVNAPELKTTEGKTLKEYLVSQLTGKGVIITTIKDRKEKFGRWLGEVEIPEIGNLSDWLIKNNYAVWYGVKDD